MLHEIFAFGATSSMAKHTCLSHVSGMCCRKVPDVIHGLHSRIFVILCCAFKFLGCHTQDFSTLLFWRNKQWNNGTEGGVGENMWKRWNSRRSSFVCCACYKKYLHGYRTARVRKEKGWNGTEAWWTGLPKIHGNDKKRRIRPHASFPSVVFDPYYQICRGLMPKRWGRSSRTWIREKNTFPRQAWQAANSQCSFQRVSVISAHFCQFELLNSCSCPNNCFAHNRGNMPGCRASLLWEKNCCASKLMSHMSVCPCVHIYEWVLNELVFVLTVACEQDCTCPKSVWELWSLYLLWLKGNDP